jgi:hypothetical protein
MKKVNDKKELTLEVVKKMAEAVEYVAANLNGRRFYY